MELRILGPLEVIDDNGEPLLLPGPRQRSLLALLALHANEVVSSDRLVDELWPAEAGGAGAAALQASVSRLRKALRAHGELLVTAAPGYSLRLGSDQLDLYSFERLVEEAENAEPGTAAEKLSEALALWRGSALADFAYEPFALAAISRLEELRLLVLEKRIGADLELGRSAELVPELESLVADYPLREGLREKLMLALYRAGRQADALGSYQSARRTLVDELGIEPGSGLQALEMAILKQDASLDLAPTAASTRSILVADIDATALQALLAVAEPLAQKPAREIIVSCLVTDRGELATASAEVARLCDGIGGRGGVGRAAVFTSDSPGVDTSRLATEQDVDLVLVAATPALLDDPELTELLRTAPCDVTVLVGSAPTPGPVLVPFAGAEHDWTAIELGAWLAGSWQQLLKLAGPAVQDGKDASRLLASASLAIQRALGVAAQPLLVEPGPDALAAAAREVAVAVVGLSDRWQKEGLGPARSALAASGQPILLVRKGLRPGGLAPVENLTRFTWSLKAS